MTSKTEINIEGTRLGVHAGSEHNIHKVFLLLKVVSIIDDTIINDLTEETNG
jgi:hypothetical protein